MYVDALNSLLWLIGAAVIGMVLIGFTIFFINSEIFSLSSTLVYQKSLSKFLLANILSVSYGLLDLGTYLALLLSTDLAVWSLFICA